MLSGLFGCGSRSVGLAAPRRLFPRWSARSPGAECPHGAFDVVVSSWHGVVGMCAHGSCPSELCRCFGRPPRPAASRTSGCLGGCGCGFAHPYRQCCAVT
eukprot:12880589-Alexandrium_andersonii.AAC.1